MNRFGVDVQLARFDGLRTVFSFFVKFLAACSLNFDAAENAGVDKDCVEVYDAADIKFPRPQREAV